MLKTLPASLAALLAASFAFGPAQSQPSVQSVLQDARNAKQNDIDAHTELAYALGLQAYVLATPYVHFDTWRANLVTRMRASGAEPHANTFLHQPGLARAGVNDGGAAPNVDTLYSNAFLDLSGGPVLLTIPAIEDRYYSVQIASASLTNVALLSRRTRGHQAGRYLLVGPAFQGAAPQDATLIRMPTNEGLILARIFAANPSDLPAAHLAQRGFVLKGPTTVATQSPVLSPAAGSGDFSIFMRSAALMRRNPPGPAEAAVMRSYQPAHLPATPDAARTLDAATQAGLERAVAMGPKVVAAGVRGLGEKVGRWTVTYQGGAYGEDYLGRAAGAVGGLLLLDPEEALYFRRYDDDQGETLDGARSYTMHFSPAALKACAAFWSLTTYDARSDLIANPANHYAVNDRDPLLHRDPDGGLTVNLSQTPPQSGLANWLPTTPGGYFTVVLRCYEPTKPVFDKVHVGATLPRLDRAS